MTKMTINSIKIQTIYIQLYRYIEDHSGLTLLLNSLDLHPDKHLPAEHKIPHTFKHFALPSYYFDWFIDSLNDYQTELFIKLFNFAEKYPIHDPNYRYDSVYSQLNDFYSFYTKLICKHYPTTFIPF